MTKRSPDPALYSNVVSIARAPAKEARPHGLHKRSALIRASAVLIDLFQRVVAFDNRSSPQVVLDTLLLAYLKQAMQSRELNPGVVDLQKVLIELESGDELRQLNVWVGLFPDLSSTKERMRFLSLVEQAVRDGRIPSGETDDEGDTDSDPDRENSPRRPTR